MILCSYFWNCFVKNCSVIVLLGTEALFSAWVKYYLFELGSLFKRAAYFIVHKFTSVTLNHKHKTTLKNKVQNKLRRILS